VGELERNEVNRDDINRPDYCHKVIAL
jgi:hypothetical protein